MAFLVRNDNKCILLSNNLHVSDAILEAFGIGLGRVTKPRGGEWERAGEQNYARLPAAVREPEPALLLEDTVSHC